MLTPAPPPGPAPERSIVAADRGSDPASRFAPEERAIFAYSPAGPRADPLAVELRLAAAMADLDQAALGHWLRSPEATRRLHGLRRLVPALRTAFGLPPFNEASGVGYAASEVFDLHRRFLAYREEVAARWRAEAELVATYGHDPGAAVAPSYERRCGLWWNRGRAQGLAAASVWRGSLAASGRGPVDFALVDAISVTREEAEELAAAMESDRATAENRARSRST